MTTPAETRPLFSLSAQDIHQIAEIVGRLAESKLPLPEVLLSMSQDLPQKSLRKALEQMSQDVSAGRTIEEALERIQDSSNREAGGMLRLILRTNEPAKSLFQILNHQQLRRELRTGFWIKLVYPIMLLLGCSLLFGALMRIIVVQFIPLFRDFGINLPGITKLVFNVADASSQLGFMGVFVPLVFCVFILAAVSLAINGTLQRWQDLAQFCRVIADLMDSGCPLAESLVITRMMATGRLGAAIDDMTELVQQGYDLPDALELQRVFPDGISNLIRWASTNGGSGAEGLRVAASLYESRGRSQSQFLTSVFTVVTMVIVIWIIIITIIAVFSPMMWLLRSLAGV